jgi:hypothetical protein
MKLLWMVAGVALAAGSVASAKDTDKDDDDTPSSEKVVCKTEKVTGSRIKVKRTCRTRAEWDEISANARQGVNDLVRSADTRSPANSSTTGAGGP